jgi:endonuclease YncB( thermonuclease family)
MGAMPRPTPFTVAFSAVLAAGLVASTTPRATADTLTGSVVRIADGDTVTVLDSSTVQHKIRLWGIDAPEIGHGRRRAGQPYGTKAKDALGDKIHGKQVSVETHGTDKYGRTLGTIFVDGRNVNQEMVAEGFAWWYERFAKHAKELAAAQEQAQSAGRGLWADKEPVPPWDWRRAQKATPEKAK